MRSAQGEAIRFDVDEIDLEVQVPAEKTREVSGKANAKGKIRF
jgi:hypothetical protein